MTAATTNYGNLLYTYHCFFQLHFFSTITVGKPCYFHCVQQENPVIRKGCINKIYYSQSVTRTF